LYYSLLENQGDKPYKILNTKTMKFLFGLMTALMITSIASAQHSDSPAGNVNIGIKGGVNVYNIKNSNDVKYDPRFGLHFGLLGHIHLNSRLALQPELVYSTQGAKTKIGSDNMMYNLDYINVPLLLQYMFDNGFRLQAGPQLGFLIRAKTKVNDTTVDIKDELKPIDVGLSVGASYVFPPTGFGLDARYNFGLSSINKESNVTSTNRGFQLGVFYIFGH
jgi:hypothetical protein